MKGFGDKASKLTLLSFLIFLSSILAKPLQARVVETITCDDVDCSDGEFLVFTIRDCKLKAGLQAFTGNLRYSRRLSALDWAKGVADHLENGCTHREIQVSEIHCAELPYSVCNCNRSQIDFARRTASVLKNCEKSLSDTIYLAISKFPLVVKNYGNVVFQPPEPRPASAAGTPLPASAAWCIPEKRLSIGQMNCEKQELAIVNKLLRGKHESLELFFAAKQKAAIALLSCLRIAILREGQCADDAISAFLTSYYELAIAPGVVVPNEILSTDFTPTPSAERALVGMIGSSHLLVSDREGDEPLACHIWEVESLLLANVFFEVEAIQPSKLLTPKFSQFYVNVYRAEMPRSPIATVIVNATDAIAIFATVDKELLNRYVEIVDTWRTKNRLTIRLFESSSLIVFQRTDPGYLNILAVVPTSVLDHSNGYFVSECDQQGIYLRQEISTLSRTHQVTWPPIISQCEKDCTEGLLVDDWFETCLYDCLAYNDTKAASNLIAIHKTVTQLNPSNDKDAVAPILVAGSTRQMKSDETNVNLTFSLLFLWIFSCFYQT